jgi:hypothetical protein
MFPLSPGSESKPSKQPEITSGGMYLRNVDEALSNCMVYYKLEFFVARNLQSTPFGGLI